ncbi:AzlD domain-containing protein [Nocardioides sp.]|uniref:AzlD domain-containing protein n=1 Tax=Nocardioides sp. TaxID=35761 RepID=UPI002734A435|nr:AzlD domain-containing protein [Nocardioides sp.]MDP3891432.1 AzlD domain-containing protein [Nocardioides sp.]
MTTILTLVAVSLGSLTFRLAPLLGARRIPDQVSRVAGWAGISVLAAITVRSVVHHQDAGAPLAPLVAAVSVAAGLLLAFRGRSVVTVLLATVVVYSVLTPVMGSVL